MAITTKPFGVMPTGEPVTLYTMTNRSGASVSMINYGAIVTSICVPDQNGMLDDVALGYDVLDNYLGPHGSMGETIGRYGNRIGRAEFEIDGTTYHVAPNNNGNHLHGGINGFGHRLWEVTTIEGEHRDTLVFHYLSPDGEESYPGTVDCSVYYSWTEKNDLVIRYTATTDKPTLLNMTNHTYFNLAGHQHGTIRDHILYIDADAITEVDEKLIPTGDYYAVAGTPFDFRDEQLIGDGLRQMKDNYQMVYGGGYDHNYVLRKGSAFGLCAAVHDEGSGRTMEVLTDQPGVQLYTASATDLPGGKGAEHYGRYCALCLETQHFPDSPHNPQFPGTTVLRPGEKYDTTTIYAFRVDA